MLFRSRDLTEKVPWINGLLTNPEKIDMHDAYEFADEQAQARDSKRWIIKHGVKDVEISKEEGKFAKPVAKIEERISKTKAAIDRLENTQDYKDINELIKKRSAEIAKQKKAVADLEKLRLKAKE